MQVLAATPITELEALAYDWRGSLARPAQVAPDGDWTTWLILAGRGFGKTRAGGEWVIEQAKAGGRGFRIALVARTASDIRDTLIEGESGILACSPPSFFPRYEPSKRRLTWPNGARASTYSADEPDLLRGPQHHAGWADELAAWRYADAWDQLQLGMRLGRHPRVCVTTTPRPTPIIRALIKDPTTAITRGSTYDNRANLAPAFFDKFIRRYEGTRLGRQELNAEILDDAPGALWKRDALEALLVAKVPELTRVVVAVDPAVTSTDESDESGIVAVGLGADGHGYVLDDQSGRFAPNEWATRAVALYHRHHANVLVAEVNNGGDLVGNTVRMIDDGVAYKAVRASHGKRTRAEPVAALYEQGRVHHVGALPVLEDQLCGWDASANVASPDRLDALVWALTELMVAPEPVYSYDALPDYLTR